MKRQFARHEIPDELITKNGPQFESAREYGFTIVKSSPYYSRGNGKAESAAKIAKSILKKSRKEDPSLALLAYRNTPQQGYNYSPAQRLMSKRFKDIIPAAHHQLTPQKASPSLVHGDIAEDDEDQWFNITRGLSSLLERGKSVCEAEAWKQASTLDLW